ncbi:small subunit ribosomal protein S1 [Candidatus Magnetomoraceae bacterium gMMP-15]
MEDLEKNTLTEQPTDSDSSVLEASTEEAATEEAQQSANLETEAEVQSAEEVSDATETGDETTKDDDNVALAGTENADENSENWLGMYEESCKRFKEGEVVSGKIVQMDKDHVLVDIGYKSEGQVPIEEFMEHRKITAKIGDMVDVMLESWDDETETVRLSKEKAAQLKIWDEIKRVYDENDTIEGIITNRVKGGFSVDVNIKAFLPGSQADLRPLRNLDELVNQTCKFKVLKYNRKRNNIVLSRRAVLEQERESKRTATLATIHEDKIMDGIVKNITEYGVFVDLGGIDGLLHITDISWGRVKHPSEFFSVGDTIKVKVLNLDLERERVSLGMKQLTEDPWISAEEKYAITKKVTGKIVSLTDYGAFVELEEGVEGLIHVSEMSWTRKIRHPSHFVSVGEEVEAVVLDISPENRRISLGMKQAVPNPWDLIGEKYPVGTTIEGRIKNITEFGLFIGIDEGIDGLVHISDISWTKRIKHPSEIYRKGQKVQAIVLDIDKSNERFSLGIKQLQPDPWDTIAERYQVGTKIKGTITNVTDFGVFVELEEGIEGLVHVSEISKEKTKTPVGEFEMDNVVEAVVVNINGKERRIGLSIKRLEMDDEKSVLSDYIHNSPRPTSTFGELLGQNLQDQAETAQEVQAAQEMKIETDQEAEAETQEAEAETQEAETETQEVEAETQEVEAETQEAETETQESEAEEVVQV